jgi:hypothetical protein
MTLTKSLVRTNLPTRSESGILQEIKEDVAVVATEVKESFDPKKVLEEIATEFKGNWTSMSNWMMGMREPCKNIDPNDVDDIMLDLDYHVRRVPSIESCSPSVDARWKINRKESIMASDNSFTSRTSSEAADLRAKRRALAIIKGTSSDLSSEETSAKSEETSSTNGDKDAAAARRAKLMLKRGIFEAESEDDEESVSVSQSEAPRSSKCTRRYNNLLRADDDESMASNFLFKSASVA